MKNSSPNSVQQNSRNVMFLCKVICVVLQVGLFAACWEAMQPYIKIYAQTSLLLLVIYTLVLVWFHRTYSCLHVGNTKVVTLCTGQLLSLMISDATLFMLATLSIRHLPSIPVFILMFILQVMVSVLWCFLANKIYYSITPAQKAAIVHYREADLQRVLDICHEKNHYEVISTIDVNSLTASISDILTQLEEADVVFLGNVPPYLQERILHHCTERYQPVIIRPTFYSMALSNAHHQFLSHTPTLEIAASTPPALHSFVKRAMDITVSALLLLVASPVMGIVALIVHHQDGGPALFRQKRLTKDGKVFEILKFRSMRVDAEKDGVARLATQNDNRITPIGKFIRATRLDELPQLWNILKGDMSLVGPRPERPEIAEQYSREIPEFNTRLQVKAGLTGYAQVHGKYNSTPQDKLLMDLMYISSQSIAQDIKLILQTIQIMLKKDSTEGIAEGQSTALAAKKGSSRNHSA